METTTSVPLVSAHHGPVTAVLLPQNARLDFLPRHFGMQALPVMAMVTADAGKGEADQGQG